MAQTPTFVATCAITLLTLATLGAAKAKYTGESRPKSAFYMVLNGGLASAAAYAIGMPINLGFRVSGFGFRVSGFGFRVQGSGFRRSVGIRRVIPLHVSDGNPR